MRRVKFCPVLSSRVKLCEVLGYVTSRYVPMCCVPVGWFLSGSVVSGQVELSETLSFVPFSPVRFSLVLFCRVKLSQVKFCD